MKEIKLGGLNGLARDIQEGMDNGELRVNKIHSERNGKEVKYVIDVLELDKEETNDVLSVKVEVDIKEANESIRELTAAANECVEAFEKLERVMERFEKKPVQTINFSPVVKNEFVKALYKDQLLANWCAGKGPFY
ncbi:hypothetical protein COK41_28710 [Bacillus cereus]|nr:hypothetical protein COK41_28710 [Bacillus cereus]